MNKLQVKPLDAPDERRTPEKTHLDLNRLGEYTIGRMTMEPGWSWSECIKPVVQTESFRLPHVGYCVSGSLETVLDDGTRSTITAGDSYTIPPGHDAHVVGEEPWVAIEFASAEAYGVPPAK
ncbi:cupin domain-containing protein [Cryobacterium sp. TMT4-10]|nr:cupin domain-containing protein [Cryobacterium sp. TMT4-10]TFD16187.1 cupin [Cryobacterium sp. TMT4-10]